MSDSLTKAANFQADKLADIIKWSSIPTELTSGKLARPSTLKFITLTSPEESQNKQNCFEVRSHVVSERRRAHKESLRAIMHSNETCGILAKLGQKCTRSLGEDSTAQSSVWHESRKKRLPPKRSSNDLSCSIPNVQTKPSNPYTLFSANSVDHFSPYPVEIRPVITENLARCKKFFHYKLSHQFNASSALLTVT